MDASEGTDELAGLFPKLATEGFEIVEPPTVRYNCIAFAAGDTGNWFCAIDDGYRFWWPIVGYEDGRYGAGSTASRPCRVYPRVCGGTMAR